MARFLKSDRVNTASRKSTRRRKKNGYIVFYMTMLQNYPTCAVKAVAKKAGELWNAMSPCEKILYKEKAKTSGTRTCQGCRTDMNGGVPHAQRNPDDRHRSGSRSACVRETTQYSVHTMKTEASRYSPGEPIAYVNRIQETVVESSPASHSRHRYVSTSEQCNCRRAPSPHPYSRGGNGQTTHHEKVRLPSAARQPPCSPEVYPCSRGHHHHDRDKVRYTRGKTPNPEEYRCSSAKEYHCSPKNHSPSHNPMLQRFSGVVLKRRCLCGAEVDVPIEEAFTNTVHALAPTPCRCKKEHRHRSRHQHQDADKGGHCNCGREGCRSAKRRSQSRARRDQNGDCQQGRNKRSADCNNTSTGESKRRHYSAWYT